MHRAVEPGGAAEAVGPGAGPSELVVVVVVAVTAVGAMAVK
jgi:hypothetical protein